MYLDESDQITYLANVIFLAHAGGPAAAKVDVALEEIRNSIGAKKSTFNAAAKQARSRGYQPTEVGDFAAQVSNLADMLYVSILDESLSDEEKSIIAEFSKSIRLTEEQVAILTKDAVGRLKKATTSLTCPNCKTTIAGDSKFLSKLRHLSDFERSDFRC